MKGLVCTFERDKYNENRYLIGKEVVAVLCVSDVHSRGVCVAHEDGTIETLNPERLTIIPPNLIPVKFDDWRVQMGFELWNQ